MQKILGVATYYNTLSTDFRVEAIASNLLKYYDANVNILIKRIGINDRPYLKDLKKIQSEHFGLDDEAIIMETYRESIYDYLPEGLFHPPSLGNSARNIESAVKEMRRQKEVEDNARKFFQPFELEFFYTEIAALLKETEFDIRDQSEMLVATLADLWPLLKRVDADTARTFFYILPFLHQVRGDRQWIERFLSAFMGIKTEIDFIPNTIDAHDDAEGLARLGKTKLGLTLIPNGKHNDGERNWRINIGPIPYEDVEKFVTGHPFRKLLQEIYEYLMPISVKIFDRFITENQSEAFILNDFRNSRLGFSTFI